LSTTAKAHAHLGNVIPSARLNPVTAYFFGMTPDPTTTDNNLVTNNWFGNQYAPDNRHNIGGASTIVFEQ
jgi:hypothetical protein